MILRTCCVNRLRADFSVLISTTEHPATVLAGPRIELGTERESLLQVLDEDTYFCGQPAASRSNRKHPHSSFEGSQKTYNMTFSESCAEDPSYTPTSPRCSRTATRIC